MTRLVTIPISHFCEKARWALDRAGIDYVEQPHLQLVHVFAARLAGGGGTVPVLVTESQVIGESAAILRWADQRVSADRRLYPAGDIGAEAAAIEACLDRGLGPDGRMWMYHETLPVMREMERWALVGVPGWERWLVRGARPVVDRAIRRLLHVDALSARAALARVEAVFDGVADRLSDGRRFLLGDRFTAADLTFAALAAPTLLPAGYGSPLPPPDAMPAGMSRVVRRLRAHAAGRFADRLYAEERARPHAES